MIEVKPMLSGLSITLGTSDIHIGNEKEFRQLIYDLHKNSIFLGKPMLSTGSDVIYVSEPVVGGPPNIAVVQCIAQDLYAAYFDGYQLFNKRVFVTKGEIVAFGNRYKFVDEYDASRQLLVAMRDSKSVDLLLEVKK